MHATHGPIALFNVKNVTDTTKLAPQFVIVARAVATPRKRCGAISEFTAQGIGDIPIPNAPM